MTVQHAKVIIIGSGFSGLGMAIQLKRSGCDDFIVLERAQDVGGAWRENHYPGCACDVESLLYSFSFEPKHDWTRKFAESGEIHDYLRHCARKYRVYPHIHFSRSMASATFDEREAQWDLTDAAGNHYSCRYLISALGPLSNPIIPDFEGLETFNGPAFHSAHWDHKTDFTDKHVAVVGSGASTIQFLPEVAKQASSVTLFQRTAPWVMPKMDRAFTTREKALFRYMPVFQKLWRGFIYWRAEFMLNAMLNTDSWMHRRAEALLGKYLEHVVTDPVTREKVRPDFKLGCKRTLLSNDYYPAINRDNVDVVNQGVQSITEHGVVDASGSEHKVDAIVFGTGFRVDDPLSGVTVRGLNGRNLNEEWRRNAFSNYYGTAISGYPNLLILAGPNTGIGHTSLIYMIEQQISYALKYIKWADTVDDGYLEVKADVQERYHTHLQSQFAGTAWSSGCDSWYLTQGGRNFTIWPSFTFRYARAMKSIRRQDYLLHTKSRISTEEVMAQ